MTVAQTGVVDWLGIEKVTGHVSLSVVDDLDWSDEQNHLLLLQEELNTYLAFIESGEVFERLVEEVGRRVPDTSPPTTAVVTSTYVTTGKLPIQVVSREFDENDGEVRQFHANNGDFRPKVMELVGLGEMCAIDPSVELLATLLPFGHSARRGNCSDTWVIVPEMSADD